MKQLHVFVTAIVEEAGRVAVVEILLLRAPRPRPSLDHLFLGGNVEPGPDLDPLHGVEFIAETAADDVHHSRTRSANEQCRASGGDELVGQIEGLTLHQLGKVLGARGRVHMGRPRPGVAFMTLTEINEGVRSMTTSTVPSDSRTERAVASGCRASNSAAATLGLPSRSRTDAASASLWVPRRMRPTPGCRARTAAHGAPCAPAPTIRILVFFVHESMIGQD